MLRTACNRRSHNNRATAGERELIARYTASDGDSHELVSFPGADGSMLVVDCSSDPSRRELLLAHLWPDEPAENAHLVCEDYLRSVRVEPVACRALAADDLLAPSPPEDELVGEPVFPPRFPAPPGCGGRFEVMTQSVPGAPGQLRWWHETDRGGNGGDATRARVVSLREAVALVEAYEPLLGLTRRAIADVNRFGRVSTTMLRAELARVQLSPIVLNRALREAVLASVSRGELSMSEIAIRCGRIKRDGRGNESGETSWLGRRLGLLPEGGHDMPTPWVHSEVLALIARSGLGVAPREVEV